MRKPFVTPQVSSLGRYRSSNGVISVPTTADDGYSTIQVNKKHYKLHRLVAFSFYLKKESEDQTTIDHIDGDSTNNKLIIDSKNRYGGEGIYTLEKLSQNEMILANDTIKVFFKK